MSGCVGQMDAFDSTVEDWATYVERVEQYCLANDIGKERQVAVLWSVMGAKTYNCTSQTSGDNIQRNCGRAASAFESETLDNRGSFSLS